MIDIAGGILLALVVVVVALLFLPMLFRAFAWLLVIAALVGLPAFFLGTELGHQWLPVALFIGGAWALSAALDRRDAKKRANSEWHIPGK